MNRITSLKTLLSATGAARIASVDFGGGGGGTGMFGVSCRGVDRSTIDRSFAAAMRSPISGGLALINRRAIVFAIDV